MIDHYQGPEKTLPSPSGRRWQRRPEGEKRGGIRLSVSGQSSLHGDEPRGGVYSLSCGLSVEMQPPLSLTREVCDNGTGENTTPEK